MREQRTLGLRGLQGVALVFIAGLLGLLAWRLIDKGSGGKLVSAVAANRKPAAPNFNLPVLWHHAATWRPARAALADGRVTLSELHGYPVVLNFWASWCVPL